VTTVCAYVEADTLRTWVGWDSRATQSGEFIVPTLCRKFRKIGAWWIGVAGNFSAMDLIESGAAKIIEADTNPLAVAAAVQGLFKDAEWKRCDDHPGAPCYEQYWMMVRKGHIFAVTEAGSVVKITPGFYAEGSGRDYAMGAMNALLLAPPFAHGRLDGGDLVNRALNAAACYDVATGLPFEVQEVCE
jgi:ATP-dependent protease HslVU (ClpYQ) peptidase subunit